MNTLILLAALTLSVSVFLIFQAIVIRRRASSMSEVERTNLLIEQAVRSHNNQSRSERLRVFLTGQGFRGDPVVFFAFAAAVYLLVVVALRLFGASVPAAIFLAVPTGLLAGKIVAIRMTARAKAAFDRDLAGVLSSRANGVKGGGALTPTLLAAVSERSDPLRFEMTRALQALQANPNLTLVEVMAELRRRYPSRAMNLFIASLDLSERYGTGVTDALLEAADSLNRDFELAAEAQAEISQARSEFFGVLAVLAFIAATSFSNDSLTVAELAARPGMALALVLAVGWFGLGLVLTNRIFTKVKGGS